MAAEYAVTRNSNEHTIPAPAEHSAKQLPPAPDSEHFASRGLTPTGASANRTYPTELSNGATASLEEIQASEAARLAYDIRQRISTQERSLAEDQTRNIASLLV